MPKGGAWSNSNNTRMLSNVGTVRNQGGGNKKAGFPYQIGRDQWASIFINSIDPISGKCCTQARVGTTMVFTRSTIRPIGNDSRIPMR